MKNFFLSLKTSVWILFILVCLFFVGSYMMPARRDIFSPMNDDILLNWTKEIAAENPLQTWWFFAALGGLILLTINAIVCSLHAVGQRWSRSDFLVRISPQVIHAGFLLILLAHLLSAASGYKLSGMVPEGGGARLPGNMGLRLEEIRVRTDTAGYMTDWSASVSLYENN